MNISRKHSFAALIILFSVSCKPTEKMQVTEQEKKETGTAELASNEARIVAKIVSIDAGRDIGGPCANAPCHGKIIIESVINTGKLFQLPDTQESLKASFAFTLSPTTEDLFPGIKTHYPGLNINDRFEATIQSRPAMGGGNSYTVYDYKKLSPSLKPYHLDK